MVPEKPALPGRRRQRPGAGGNFYDTAFVVGPDGDIVFRQVKAVPIQFFKDGLPAPEQKLWNSPWGKIGICVCYDLSYTRVTDRLVKLGAEALIVPTMDVVDWGQAQHELHGRIAPARATEYGLPIFRLASSGISQSVDCAGHVTATAPLSRRRRDAGGDARIARRRQPAAGPLAGAAGGRRDGFADDLVPGPGGQLAFRNCLLRPNTLTLSNP